MQIGIVGYGKMGRMVEAIAKERGHSIAFSAGSGDTWSRADVIIEFTRSEAVIPNIERAMDQGIPIVTGTTGWKERIEEVTNMVNSKGGSMVHANNFSLGVNLFYDVSRRLARAMAPHPDYRAQMEETHHLQKLDSPSGTAISLAQDLISEHPAYDRWQNHESTEQGTLPIISKREPEVPGTHIITWENDIDTIEIKHTAKNRKGFALGAVVSAEWLIGRSGVFTISDVIGSMNNAL
ncbi:MAG: 4-hydroxy-tetrahydrodipicolinate reductase [Flavobacteriales bacterium]|nr:4-hydroxy-tetrahydrodipicolinate reductase [Flavobacteriales bacterium]